MFNFSGYWDTAKAWFKRSETIFLARVEAFTGLVVAGISAMDWSPLLNLGVDAGMSLKQGVTLGGIMFAKGLVTEWARRRNTVEVDNSLLPTDIVKEVKTEVKVEIPSTEVKVAKIKKIKK